MNTKEEKERLTVEAAQKEKETEKMFEKPKSKITLFWENYLKGVPGEILDMRAVLK